VRLIIGYLTWVLIFDCIQFIYRFSWSCNYELTKLLECISNKYTVKSYVSYVRKNFECFDFK